MKPYPKETNEERVKRHLANSITVEEAHKRGMIPTLTAAQKRIRKHFREGPATPPEGAL
jgi:hypothetical protein